MLARETRQDATTETYDDDDEEVGGNEWVDRAGRFQLQYQFAVFGTNAACCQCSSVAQWQSIRLLTGGL